MGAEWSAAFPLPGARGAVLQPTLHPCSAGKKNRAQAAPLAASKHRLLASAGVAGSVPGEHPFLFC